MKLGHFRTNSTQVFVDLKKQTWKKFLEQIGAFVPTRATPKSTLVTDKWTSTSPVRTEKSLDMNGEDGKDMYRKMNGN